MAEQFRAGLRASDPADRIGGDELLLVLPGLQGLEDGLAIVKKMRRLASEPVPIPQGHMQIILSLGVALAGRGESLDAPVARAEAAMYDAKQRGRNPVVAIPRRGSTAAAGHGSDASCSPSARTRPSAAPRRPKQATRAKAVCHWRVSIPHGKRTTRASSIAVVSSMAVPRNPGEGARLEGGSQHL